jgi:hypothetical protein
VIEFTPRETEDPPSTMTDVIPVLLTVADRYEYRVADIDHGRWKGTTIITNWLE